MSWRCARCRKIRGISYAVVFLKKKISVCPSFLCLLFQMAKAPGVFPTRAFEPICHCGLRSSIRYYQTPTNAPLPNSMLMMVLRGKWVPNSVDCFLTASFAPVNARPGCDHAGLVEPIKLGIVPRN